MELEFDGPIFEWRGPAPYYFVTVPDDEAGDLKSVEAMVSYGWGMIPATVTIGDTEWETALWPRNGAYVVPLKDRIRDAEGLVEGQTVTVRLSVAV